MGSGGDEVRVLEWEDGLPSTDDLTPLSHPLISPVLASAFSITPEPCRTVFDVNRASQSTLSSLQKLNHAYSLSNFKSLPCFGKDRSGISDPVVFEAESQTDENDYEHKIENDDPRGDGSEKCKLQTVDNIEEDNSNDDQIARALKRPRLVWTPQLHKRFVEVVAHLGIRNAVPKNIMQLMNVDGLTRENVASHLQKYRLYLKRMQGGEVPSISDKLFASAPVPPSLNESIEAAMPVPMPYGHPLMPVFAVGHGSGHMRTPVGNPPTAAYPGFDWNHYNMYREQQRDWSWSGNNFGSIVSHHPVSPNK